MSMNNLPGQSEEAAFVVLQGMRGLGVLSKASTEPRERVTPVMFGELVHYAYGTAVVDEDRIRLQLNSNLVLRGQLNQLLERANAVTLPRLAQAASDEPLKERVSRDFSLKFKRSKANSEHIYVLLTVYPESGLGDGHASVLLARKSDDVGRLCFPELRDNSAQLILMEGDYRLELACDPNAELSLL